MNNEKTPSTDRCDLPVWRLSIPGWMELGVEQFHVEPTYLGVLEGTPEDINPQIVEEIPRRVKKRFFSGVDQPKTPLYFEKPAAGEMRRALPPYLCMAMLTSDPAQGETPDDEVLYSVVVYCWFTDAIGEAITPLLQKCVRRFPWEQHAMNCYF